MPLTFTNHNPSSLEEAITIIVSNLSEEERDCLEQTHSAEHHHSFGRGMRNNWGLWNEASILYRHFNERFGLTHADDMSGMILEGVSCNVQKREFDPEAEAERYLEYWREQEA